MNPATTWQGSFPAAFYSKRGPRATKSVGGNWRDAGRDAIAEPGLEIETNPLDQKQPPSDGNIFEPSDDRWKVRGGWRRPGRLDGGKMIGLALTGAAVGLLLSTRRAR